MLFSLQHYFLSTHINNPTRPYANKKTISNYKIYSKVWAHRVNSLERYQYLRNSFSGFEVDVVFMGNHFDVGHPPLQSINLSFEKYLKVAGSGKKLFWLDLKNLSAQNEIAIINHLNKLDSLYNIKSRIIIESNNIPSLSRISLNGYFTTYYYDNDSYNKLVASGNKEKLTIIDAISQDISMYDTLRNKFPQKPRLTWALSFSNYFSHKQFNKLDKDSLLLVYLVNIKSPSYR